MTEPSTLDDQQKQAVEARWDARQIVLAGPGAGKTHVVGERCRRLVDRDEVYPEEVLVISFSNAAVDVVRARTSEVCDHGRGIDCSTIDALAARVRHELEDDPVFTGYEQAVVRATQLLMACDGPVFSDIRHVIIDEVQDVVGVRAQFALALLEKAFEDGIGFTLLGDPLQGIYDFQLDDAREWSADRFLRSVVQRWSPTTVTLLGEYRGRTLTARAAALARPLLVELPENSRLQRLQDILASLDPLGAIDEDSAHDVTRWPGTTALLSDTNARAGLAADLLTAYGIGCELASRALDPSIAPWVAELLGEHEGSYVTFDDFRLLLDDEDEAENRWRALVRFARSPRGLELRDLATALGARRVPAELTRAPQSRIVSSTVHRAKGLEFDNVVLVDPDGWYTGPDDESAAARRLFVALSRGRSTVTSSRGIRTDGWAKDPRTGAWIRYARQRRGTLGILLEPRMARALGPSMSVSSSLIDQSIDWESGPAHITVEGSEVPSWIATVNGARVARTGEEFGNVMDRMSYGRLPKLVGGHVEGLETLVGPARQDGPGRHGLWLGARVAGNLNFDWS